MKLRAFSLHTQIRVYVTINSIYVRIFPIKRSDGLNYIFHDKIDKLL